MAFAFITIRKEKKPVVIEKPLPITEKKVVTVPVVIKRLGPERAEKKVSETKPAPSTAPSTTKPGGVFTIPEKPPKPIEEILGERTSEEKAKKKETIPVATYEEIKKEAATRGGEIDILVREITPTHVVVTINNRTGGEELLANIALDTPVDLGNWPGWKKVKVCGFYEYLRGLRINKAPLPPGRSYTETERFPKPLPPGRYRIVVSAFGEHSEKTAVVEFKVVDGRVEVTREINVSRTARLGPAWSLGEAYSTYYKKKAVRKEWRGRTGESRVEQEKKAETVLHTTASHRRHEVYLE